MITFNQQTKNFFDWLRYKIFGQTRYVQYYSYKIFGTSREQALANAKHLAEEAQELIEAIESGDLKHIGSEMADIHQLNIDIAGRLEVDLNKEVYDKMQIVKSRVWLPPDKNGIIRHKK